MSGSMRTKHLAYLTGHVADSAGIATITALCAAYLSFRDVTSR